VNKQVTVMEKLTLIPTLRLGDVAMRNRLSPVTTCDSSFGVFVNSRCVIVVGGKAIQSQGAAQENIRLCLPNDHDPTRLRGARGNGVTSLDTLNIY
jgi:hypothetical protein